MDIDLTKMGVTVASVYIMADVLKTVVVKILERFGPKRGDKEQTAICNSHILEPIIKEMRESQAMLSRSQEEIAMELVRAGQVNERVLEGLKDMNSQMRDGFRDVRDDMRSVLKAVNGGG